VENGRPNGLSPFNVKKQRNNSGRLRRKSLRLDDDSSGCLVNAGG
jgi:hypothetical protein